MDKQTGRSDHQVDKHINHTRTENKMVWILLRSKSLWRCYINPIIVFLDISIFLFLLFRTQYLGEPILRNGGF
jgi:fumarate reductase subunit D